MGNNMSDFREGDDLMIGIKDLEVIEQMQQNHGGWNDKMKECIQGPCKLIQGLGSDVLIKGPSGNVYRVNVEILTKYVSNEFTVGSEMTLISNESEMKKLQSGHGGWSDGMRDLLGKSVEIVQRFPDGDYKIKANGRTWTVNPDCFLVAKSKEQKPISKGDKVRIINNKGTMMSLQENHGGWSELMSLIVGEEVEVLEVLGDGDYYVSKYGMKWMVNSMCFESESKNNNKKDNDTEQLCKGDSVKICDSLDQCKELQNGHGGFVAAMKQLLGKTGQVEVILPTGDVKVNVSSASYVYNRKLLTKVTPAAAGATEVFKVGDKVKVIKNKTKVKSLQKGHGEWNESMRLILGEKGRVKSMFPDGDLRVKVMGNLITLNPECVRKCDSDSDSDSDTPDLMKMISRIARMTATNSDDDDEEDEEEDDSKKDSDPPLSKVLGVEHMKLFAAVKTGDLEQTKRLLDVVGPNTSKKKITPLAIAVNEGHEHIVSLLLDKGANIDFKDSDGDTALHLGVQKNRSEICKVLVNRGANINHKNNHQLTPVMLAASSGSQDILRYLVKVPGVDLDFGDKDKETALHLAIQKSRLESVEILLEAGADMLALNEKLFNPFHFAALRGHERILEVFLKKAGPSIVDLQKEDKFAAVHLAALNNHPGCLKTLLKYNADVNIRNGKLQTALHIAVSQRYFECVKILVENKAELNLKDESGDTPLHDGVRAHNMEKMKKIGDVFGIPDVFKLFEGVQRGSDEPDKIVLYLAEKGATLDIKNNSGKTVITACDDQVLKEKLLRIKEGQAPLESIGMEKNDNEDISAQEVEELRLKIKALEDENMCSICCDRRINSTFQCGHVSCDVCANNLFECHICRSTITNIIKIFR